MPLASEKKSSRGSSVYRNVLAITLLVAVLCSALMSWSSSRTLSFSLGGAWRSVDEGRMIASCEGASTWSGVCTVESSHTRFSGQVQASPLSGGGWVAVVRAAPLNTSVFVHRGKVLTVTTEMEDGSSRHTVYTRDQARTEDFLSAVRMKGKYIVALFVMVGAYKWVQVSVFGTSTRRHRRF